MKKTFDVKGMSCQNCVKHVTHALESVAGVETVSVDLAAKQAEVSGNYQDEALVEAVKQSGYEIVQK